MMLKIEHLCYSYKKNCEVLHDITAEIGSEFCFLVGENGSGKSTFIKNIAKIVQGSGNIMIGNIPWNTESYSRKLSYLPQEFDVYPTLRVKELLEFTAGLKGISPETVKSEIDAVAEKTNISSFLDKKFKTCSGGMRRRVGIATTLLGSPEVVLLDEPTAGIDPKERFQFYQSLKECFSGRTVIISTHILDDAEFLADSIIMLARGRVQYYDKYDSFQHSLDGRVYEIVCTRQEIEALTNQHIVLSYTQKSADCYACRMIPKSPIPSNAKPVDPTTGDLWFYYQREKDEV